ncbi:sodium/potassium-transporting ATPase subunit beta-2-like [Convolutriloba macropyga]|uniref:sodium/potassium-transporting ATPase subunit beta-2-like n=1 Tax=Convolutriloba macropyga TaxID=536237 RepID=UPI003F52493B
MEGIRKTISTNWEDFKVFLWNKETKEVAGRTGKSWAEIGLFYLVFYGLLAAWWAFHLFVATTNLPDLEEGPKYSDYLTHRGPGLHVVPQANAIGRDKQKVYFQNDQEEYLDTIHKFIKGQSDTSLSDGNTWGDCSKDKVNASWAEEKPCFYFYLNAVHGFKPEPKSGEESVTIECKSAKNTYDKYFTKATAYPTTGFDLDKFPWKHGVDWDKDAPVVAVQIELNKEYFKNKGDEARIVCSASAANIYLDKEKPNIGSVDFRIRKN